MTGCVYMIKNIVTGNFYVGRTHGFNSRVKEHFGLLKSGRHHSSKMNNDYQTYGEKSFVYGIVADDFKHEYQVWNKERAMIWHLLPAYNSTNRIQNKKAALS